MSSISSSRKGPQEDSSVTPKWQVVSNTSLYGTIGGALVDHNIGTTVKTYTPGDGARPVITYTLAALGSNKAYVHFSELVYGDYTQLRPDRSTSLTYSGGAITVQPVEMTGNGAHAAIVTLPAALTANRHSQRHSEDDRGCGRSDLGPAVSRLNSIIRPTKPSGAAYALPW